VIRVHIVNHHVLYVVVAKIVVLNVLCVMNALFIVRHVTHVVLVDCVKKFVQLVQSVPFAQIVVRIKRANCVLIAPHDLIVWNVSLVIFMFKFVRFVYDVLMRVVYIAYAHCVKNREYILVNFATYAHGLVEIV
jgi:hypothetical protein